MQQEWKNNKDFHVKSYSVSSLWSFPLQKYKDQLKATLKATGLQHKSFETHTQDNTTWQCAITTRTKNFVLLFSSGGFNLILYQHYHSVNAIRASRQELIYLVINAITIKEAISKEEIKFLDTRDKAADNIQVTYKAAVKE